MANLCLPKSYRDKLAKALKEGDISISKLYSMSDAERQIMFKQYVGKDFAAFVNAKFEQAMVSNQKKALANWLKRTLSAKDPVRRDMLKKVSKIEKFLAPIEEKGFLKDLAELKLGINVTEEEAKTIIDFSKKIEELRVKIPTDTPKRSTERLAYGFALDDFKQYVGALKNEADTLTFTERFKPQNYGRQLLDVADITKSLVATLDDSFLGRQGWSVLLAGKYKVWGTTVLESFKNIARELVAKEPGLFKSRSDAVMRAIRADIYSRPNALNGSYKAAKNGYGLGVLHEEFFPSSAPERIPFLGRIFKAAETAFNGSALRMRADLADAYIDNAVKNGVDVLDERIASVYGELAGGLTGRGEIGRVGAVGRATNALFFSIRFLKSNLDILTAPVKYAVERDNPARKTAALETLKIAASITAILTTAKMLGADVDFDPRSAKFGTIGFRGHRYDVTRGMRGLVTLGSRLIPTLHNGQWSSWTKSSTTGKYTNLSDAEYGQQTALDVLEQFIEGKFSPTAGMVRDILKGRNFQGDQPTPANIAGNLLIPISAQTLTQELKKGNDDLLLVMLAEAFGFSAIPTTFQGSGKKWDKLKETKGEKVYNEALKQVTERYNQRTQKLQATERFKKLNNDEQNKELNKIRTEETNMIFKRYGIAD